MGITRNKNLLSHLIPRDNALEKNIKLGAFHFRMWKLGEWYDVVIDDFLLVDKNTKLIFAQNLSFKNAFWIALFEKAIAK